MGAGKKDITILYGFDFSDFYVRNKREEYVNAGPRKSKFGGSSEKGERGKKRNGTLKGSAERRSQFNEQVECLLWGDAQYH